jgi:hypothetical protein
MTINYTTLLGLAQPVPGTEANTWGDVVNDSITELVEDAIAGSATAVVTSGDWTLTTTGSGAANQARSAILIPTGTPGVSRNIIAPSSSKAYIVDNQSNAAVVIKGAATTGVSIATNTAALVAWDGADFVLVAQDLANATGTLPVAKGGTGQTTYTDGQLLIGNSSGNTLAKATLTQGTGVTITNGAGSITIAATGSGGTVTSVAVSGGTTGLTVSGSPITTSGTITLAGTLAVANGGTGITSFGTGVATALGQNVTGTGSIALATTPVLVGSRITVSALGTLTTGTTTIDLATAQVYTATITAANTITIAFSNAPSAGQSQVVLLRLTDAGGGTIVWPANTKFTAGAAPTLTTSGVDVLGVYYDVTTTTYMVFVIGLDVKVP